MQRIANTRDFQIALLQVIRQANQPRPSRHVIAERLEGLAERLGARRAPAKTPKAPGSRSRNKKTEEPRTVGPQVLVNIAAKEADKLSYLKMVLEGAAREVQGEIKHIRRRIETLEVDAEDDGKALAKADIATKWVPGRFFAGEILDPIIKAVDYLADMLEDHESITNETDLTQAVREFKKEIPTGGIWPEGKGEEHFLDVIKAFNIAAGKVPTGLTKRSDLTKLSDAFEAIAEVTKLMTGDSIRVPKIPKALDPEDPRQLGFGFSASSRRIASTTELKGQLDAIWQASSEPRPARQALGTALFTLASRLRP